MTPAFSAFEAAFISCFVVIASYVTDLDDIDEAGDVNCFWAHRPRKHL